MSSAATEKLRILVTGANTGIGLALCKQLCKDHNAHVYLGSRDAKKGAAAVDAVKAHCGDGNGVDASVELVQIDVSNDDSVKAAAGSLKGQGVRLYAIVNNAGAGLSHGVGPEEIINVNIHGPKRVVDSFLPLLVPEGGRIVNVGSGAGPMYVAKQSVDRQKVLCSPEVTWEQIEDVLSNGLTDDSMGGYGVSKACLMSYTMLLAREHPNVMSTCLSPGFIDTGITAGYGATKTPEEGTVSLRHCLFADLPPEANGWFFGSDAKRSPLHILRNPGEPEFDGKLPW